MDPKNFTVRVELAKPTPERLVQVDDIMMTLEFLGYATKKNSDQGWLFQLPSGLFFGQSQLDAESICRRASALLCDHQLECRLFVAEVVDWSGMEVAQTTGWGAPSAFLSQSPDLP